MDKIEKSKEKKNKKIKMYINISKDYFDYVNKEIDGIKFYNINHYFEVLIKRDMENKK